ncbi:MAG: cobyrinate a,c-diamide synthase [Bacteroidaceae bacterium]|nr:cobyrinate a,c-diamide synthase [Bacteroidaceae bacterium]
MRLIPQFMIAAPSSGSGKTTVSRGLMALLTRKGFKVQPYKCGPDYIDTKFHERVCNRPSYNLDSFFASKEHLLELYFQHAQEADICVAEGMMGLFDGYDRDNGSCSEVARILDLPIVLVVNAQSAAYSLAALINGFLHFRYDVKIIGVIFNNVGSEKHERMLSFVCSELKVPCFGYIPKRSELMQQSRYLGLDFSEIKGDDALADLIEKHVDWQRILQASMRVVPTIVMQQQQESKAMKIWVARNDESFSFIYAEHLDLLHSMGLVTFFNPEEDQEIPLDIDLLYLPGGYPEKHAEALVEARNTRASIKQYIEKGGRTLAECGGMIYLSQGIVGDEDMYYEMAGVLPFKISIRKQDRKLSLGYRDFDWEEQRYRGHEFHYTQFLPEEPVPPSSFKVFDAVSRPISTPIFRYKNLIASYTHLYWGETGFMNLFDYEEDLH